jgi:hypothetical protein
MKAKYYFIFSLLFTLITLSGVAIGNVYPQLEQRNVKQEIQPSDSLLLNGLQFGFADASGTHILMLTPGDENINPADYKQTISADGKVIPVRFLKEKQATSTDNHRQTANNFENSGGYLYEVINGTVSNANSVLLLTEEFINNYKAISFTRPENRLSIESNSGKKIETERKWKINSSILLAQIDKSHEIYMLVFKPQGDSILADLIFTGLAENVYFDYPAHKSENSVWRVDDGGEFGEEYFSILVVFKSSDNYVIVTDWAGAEGFSIQLLGIEGDHFIELKNSYRYTAPD